MSAFIVAQVRIHDPARYDRYARAFLHTLKPFDGRLLAADEQPRVLEGGWDGKLNIIAFPDEEAASAWMNSPEYQEIIGDRLAASEANVMLVRGFG